MRPDDYISFSSLQLTLPADNFLAEAANNKNHPLRHQLSVILPFSIVTGKQEKLI